jgi:hypothetical protein
VRFPDARGLYYVAVPENDVTPILDQVKEHSERTRKKVGCRPNWLPP